jgi:hypothetical protein
LPQQNKFLAAGQTMTVGELRAALAYRDAHERVNVSVVIIDEAVALEDLVKVTYHQPFDPEEDESEARKEFNRDYRSVCLHISARDVPRLLHPRRPVSSFTF